MASRFSRYVRRLARTAIALALLALILAAIQAVYHPFDPFLAAAKSFVDELDSRLSRELFNGITIGSLVLILGLCVFPIFLRKIDERAYGRGLWRGIISAAVFFLANALFALASKISRTGFILSIVGVAVVGAVIVEAVSLAAKEEEERSFRTDIVASIASGLLFGVIVKLAEYGLEFIKRKIG